MTGPMTSCSQRASGRYGIAVMAFEIFFKTGVFAKQMSTPFGSLEGGA